MYVCIILHLPHPMMSSISGPTARWGLSRCGSRVRRGRVQVCTLESSELELSVWTGSIQLGKGADS